MIHSLRMLAGCVLPILPIFLLPLMGIGEGITMFMAIALMFACHLLMMGSHNSDHREKNDYDEGDGHAHA